MPFFGIFGGDEGTETKETVEDRGGTVDSVVLDVSSRNLVPVGDGVRWPWLPAGRVGWVELVVLSLERVFEERDEDLSDDDWWK